MSLTYQWIRKNLRGLNCPHTLSVWSFFYISLFIRKFDCIFRRHTNHTCTCFLHFLQTTFKNFFCHKRSCTVMDQYIFTVSAFTKTCIDRIIAFFSSRDYCRYLCKSIFLHDFFFTVGDRFLSCHKNNILNQRTFLKTAQGIIQNRVSLYLQELLLYFTVHSFSLPCCQNNGRISFWHLNALPV